jgi:hypothetical protein
MSQVEVPPCVSDFLKLTKNLEDLKNQQKHYKQQLKMLQPSVSDFLKTVPSFEVPLNFLNNEEIEAFGNSGKLRFAVRKKKQAITAKLLSRLLFEWFSSTTTDKTTEQVKETSVEIAAYIWSHRKEEMFAPVPVRTFNKAKKRKKMFH